MAYISSSADDEDLKKKQGAGPIGGEAADDQGGQGGLPAAGQAAQPYTQTGFASAKNIFSKNKDAGDQYDVTKPFQEDLDKGRAELSSSFGKLQNSLGQQVSGQKASDDDLSDAIAKGSQSGNFQKILGALKPTNVSGEMDKVNSRYNANDVASLNTAPGIQAALANQAAQKGVQNYSQGMGALDAAIYQNNPQYRQKIADLSKSYGEYDKQKQDYADQSKTAIDKSNKELQDSAASLRSKLQNQGGDLQKNYSQGGDAYNQQKFALGADQYQQAEAEKQRYIVEAVKSLPEQYQQDFREKAGHVNARQSVSPTYSDTAYTDDAASRFNNIMALLGQNNRVAASSAGSAKFDKEGLDKQLQFYSDAARKNVTEQQGREALKASEAAKAAEENNKPKTPWGAPVLSPPGRGGTQQEKDAYYNQQLKMLFG